MFIRQEAFGVSKHQSPPNEWVRLLGGAIHGTVNNKVRNFQQINIQIGEALTPYLDAALGASVVVNEAGLYYIDYLDNEGGSSTALGITIDERTDIYGTASIVDVPNPPSLGFITVAATFNAELTRLVFLKKGQVIRAHTDGGPDSTTLNFTMLNVIKVTG